MPDKSNLARVAPQPRTPTPAAVPTHPAKPPRPPMPTKKTAPAKAPRVGGGPVLAVILVALAVLNVYGWRYYSLPLAERVRSPLHPWLRPSGYIGQSAGIVSLLIFIFLWLYPLRKKYKQLAWTGTVASWLDIHILTALGLPLLLTVHAAWRFDELIGLGFWSMMVVVASGIVGRYIYVRIPRGKSGVELTRGEVTDRRRELVEQISGTLGLDVATVERTLALRAPKGTPSVIGALGQLLTNDLQRWRMRRELRRRWKSLVKEGSFSFKVQRAKHHRSEREALDEVVALASRELSLAQQARMLDATQRVFKWWHVAHRPFALTALVAVVIHVAVVVALGATWFH